jgi:hypothetical protein
MCGAGKFHLGIGQVYNMEKKSNNRIGATVDEVKFEPSDTLSVNEVEK